MVPEKLQDCLIEELKEIFKGIEYKDLSGEYSAINIFKQKLPPKKYEEDPDVKFPCIIVELKSGTTPTEQDQRTCIINFIIGVIESDDAESGFSAVFSIINKISYLLETKRIFNDCYEFQYPLTWDTAEDESNPFYYGSIETSWNVPKITQGNKETAAWL